MPFQVNGQAVTTKSSRLLQVAGGSEAAVVAAGTAFVAMMSSAAASVAYTALASPKIIDAKTPTLFIPPPPEYPRSRSCAVLTYTATIVLGKSPSAALSSRSKRQARSGLETHV